MPSLSSEVPSHSLRLTYSRAFQAPDYSQYFLGAAAGPPVDLSGIEDALAAVFGMDLNLGFESVPVLAPRNRNLKVEEITPALARLNPPWP